MSEQNINEEKGKKLEDIRRKAEEKACPIQIVLYYINEFLSGPMCGRCFPCSLGTQEAKIILIKISQYLDNITDADIDTLRRIGIYMTEGSLCKKGKDTGKFITEQLDKSLSVFKSHLSSHCQERECVTRTEYVINPDLCIMCGKCLEACKYNAIIGNIKETHAIHSFPFEIIQKKCTRCGECIKVCPTEAIDIVINNIEELVSTNQQS